MEPGVHKKGNVLLIHVHADQKNLSPQALLGEGYSFTPEPLGVWAIVACNLLTTISPPKNWGKKIVTWYRKIHVKYYKSSSQHEIVDPQAHVQAADISFKFDKSVETSYEPGGGR